MWWGHKEDGIPYCHAGWYFSGLEDGAVVLTF
jgi:hypothetical protein